MKAFDIIGTDKRFDDILPFLVEVKLKGDVFLSIVESLRRVGVRGKTGADGRNTLIQTCNILHKKGKYYICHFKSLFLLDGLENHLVNSDIARQNTIIWLLRDWGLIEIVKPEMLDGDSCSLKTIKVVKFNEQKEWNLVSKYKIGVPK